MSASLARTRHLTRLRLRRLGRTGWPLPALLFLASLAAVLALLVRDALPPFPYALLATSLGGLLLALPLLGDLTSALRHDEAAEWIGAQPLLARELALARLAEVLVVLALLSAAWFVPWAALAPPALTAGARLALPFVGLALVLALATVVVWTQALLLARRARALVLLETVWTVAIVVALVELLGRLRELAQLTPASAGLGAFPPAWLARALVAGGPWPWIAAAAAAPCLAALYRLPGPGSAAPPRASRALAERWLRPLHALATRAWVRPEERGTFELVYRALPREREFVLRTYPMVGIPLAFLWIGASQGAAGWRSDLLALLFFTAGVSFPLLLTHLPLTESPEAAWIQRTAPVGPRARAEGALKAVFVRWVLPLYLALLALALGLGEAALAARLWPMAVLVALLLLRFLHPRCSRDLPLSTGPDELRSGTDWAGLMTGVALGLTVLAVAANRLVDARTGSLAALALLVLEGLAERSRDGRRPRVAAPHQAD